MVPAEEFKFPTIGNTCSIGKICLRLTISRCTVAIFLQPDHKTFSQKSRYLNFAYRLGLCPYCAVDFSNSLKNFSRRQTSPIMVFTKWHSKVVAFVSYEKSYLQLFQNILLIWRYLNIGFFLKPLRKHPSR